MLQELKNNDGLKELLFFLFANPSRTYKYKADKALRCSRTPTPVSVRVFRSLLIISTMLLLLNQLLYAQQMEAQALPGPKGNNLLFFLQPEPYANTVVYELNYDSNGTLSKKDPIKGSWIRYEAAQQFKALSNMEKRFAYGVQSKAIAEDEYEIRLVAYKKMPMYLRKSGIDQKYHIYIKDEGENLLLKRVFVRIKGGSFWFPKVQYIDLITVNSATGIEILKRIRT